MQGQYTKPAQINSATDSKTVPASNIKGQCTGNTPNTLNTYDQQATKNSDMTCDPDQKTKVAFCPEVIFYLTYSPDPIER